MNFTFETLFLKLPLLELETRSLEDLIPTCQGNGVIVRPQATQGTLPNLKEHFIPWE